ncbi:hypothetical protein CEXT_551, partial [Caerostris extrusa]
RLSLLHGIIHGGSSVHLDQVLLHPMEHRAQSGAHQFLRRIKAFRHPTKQHCVQ